MKLKKHSFTLVELIVSMAVFALLSMMVVRLFSASQKLWVSNTQKSEITEEGRMALDFISNLLMSATVNPQLDNARVGSDYFELKNDGEKPDPDGEKSSRLYFVTKSDSPALVSNSPDVPACFVGIQVVHLNGGSYSDDPDKDHYVLVVSAKTSADGTTFAEYFPNNTQGAAGVTTLLDDKTDTSFSNIVSNSSYKVSRIATNVVDFQVRAYTSSQKIKDGDESSDTLNAANASRPEAIEIELTLMDRNHYENFINSDDADQRASLRNQFSRTFRRIVWLDGTHRTYDMSGDF